MIEIMGRLLLAGYVVVISLIYLAPTIIASNTKHPQKDALTIINIFLGWTFIGWVICLAWAVMGDSDEYKDESN